MRVRPPLFLVHQGGLRPSLRRPVLRIQPPVFQYASRFYQAWVRIFSFYILGPRPANRCNPAADCRSFRRGRGSSPPPASNLPENFPLLGFWRRYPYPLPEVGGATQCPFGQPPEIQPE